MKLGLNGSTWISVPPDAQVRVHKAVFVPTLFNSQPLGIKMKSPQQGFSEFSIQHYVFFSLLMERMALRDPPLPLTYSKYSCVRAQVCSKPMHTCKDKQETRRPCITFQTHSLAIPFMPY